MNKKILIAFIVVILACTALVYFRNLKNDQKNQEITQKAFVKITQIAKKIPQAGLTQMGMALKAYKDKNGSYPDSLDKLYPDYIPSEEFISDLDWDYQQNGNNFHLVKSIERNGTKLVASIDSTLEPKVGAGLMVASRKKPQKAKPASKALKLAKLEDIKPVVPAEGGYGLKGQIQDELIKQPEVISMKEGDIGLGVSDSISRKYLVWRDKNGHLGFGNIVYPETRRLSIYKDRTWIDIKRPPSDKSGESSVIEGKSQKESPSPITRGRNYLVWKDKSGAMGFGNVEYPDKKGLTVYNNDQWVGIDQTKGLHENERVSNPKSQEKKKDLENIAAEYSRRYLVWKDKKGHIGYSNVQYPEKGDIAFICVNGTWQKFLNKIP